MNAYQGNNPYVFVSYAHKDNEKVLDLIKLLKRKMCRIWYDEGLTPGGSWNDDLANHISKCECVIIIITNNSIQSQYVKSELNYAISLNKKNLSSFFRKCRTSCWVGNDAWNNTIYLY